MVVVSPLWRGPGNIHGFILDAALYRFQFTSIQNMNEENVRSCLACNTVPAKWYICVNKGPTY